MFIDLGDLSQGMGMIFMREFMETANQTSCNEGQLLFRQGDAIHYFFTFIQGELRLTIGANEQHVYTVCHAGDSFGWSSRLVGGNAYRATAVCRKLCTILGFDRDKLLDLLGKHSESDFLFFKKLSEILGKHLLEPIAPDRDILEKLFMECPLVPCALCHLILRFQLRFENVCSRNRLLDYFCYLACFCVVNHSLKVYDDNRLMSDNPCVMTRGKKGDVTGSRFKLSTVVHHDLYHARNLILKMRRFATLRLCNRLDRRRPFPTRLKYRTADRCAAYL